MRISVDLSEKTLAAMRELAQSEGVTIDQVIERALMATVQIQRDRTVYGAAVFGDPSSRVAVTDEDVLRILDDEDRQRLGY